MNSFVKGDSVDEGEIKCYYFNDGALYDAKELCVLDKGDNLRGRKEVVK